MDYKKIFKSRKLRKKILDALRFIPDKPMVKLQYRLKTGRKLNLENPKRFTEKLQWYKLYYRDPLMAQCADKYEVRKYVESLGLGNILNECYGVFDHAEDVDFDKLPNQFVLKDTLGGGGNSVIICKDKSKADLNEYRRIMRKWVDSKCIPSGGREWVYYCGKKHRVIAEKLLVCEDGDLPDYKFYCFNGLAHYFYIRTGYLNDHKGCTTFYTSKGLPLKVKVDYSDSGAIIDYDDNTISRMKNISGLLSKMFPHVRVDLFCVENMIIFGELTFFTASGYFNFAPDEFDYEFGAKWKLPPKNSGGGNSHL